MKLPSFKKKSKAPLPTADSVVQPTGPEQAPEAGAKLGRGGRLPRFHVKKLQPLKFDLEVKAPNPRLIAEDLRYRAHIPQDLHAARLKSQDRAEQFWEHFTKVSLRNYNNIAFGIIVFMIISLLMFGSGLDLVFVNYMTIMILLLLVVVIFGQSRIQERALDNYIPRLGLVRVSKAAAYHERIKVSHLVELLDDVEQVKEVKFIKVTYGIVNTSFADIIISNASLVLKTAAGKIQAAPDDIVLSHVKPSAEHATSITFGLESPVDFDSIEEAEFHLIGNCSKTVKVRPQLFACVSASRDKVQDIFEPWEKFKERMEALR